MHVACCAWSQVEWESFSLEGTLRFVCKRYVCICTWAPCLYIVMKAVICLVCLTSMCTAHYDNCACMLILWRELWWFVCKRYVCICTWAPCLYIVMKAVICLVLLASVCTADYDNCACMLKIPCPPCENGWWCGKLILLLHMILYIYIYTVIIVMR